MAQAALASASIQGMVRVPSGTYEPFYAPRAEKKEKKPVDREPVAVESFWLDRLPVTNREYLEFVRVKPEWRKSRRKPVFSDRRYLERWRSDLALKNPKEANSPVTFVSWFSAEAYCEWKGKTLPTVDQWEYAAADRGRGAKEAKDRILSWYGRTTPKTAPAVGGTPRNGYGIQDLHGLIWEWTLDFNSAIQSQEAREDGTKDDNLFCGNGSQGALDATDYASFMRYGFRNSLKANYAVANLGFRCAKEIEDHD